MLHVTAECSPLFQPRNNYFKWESRKKWIIFDSTFWDVMSCIIWLFMIARGHSESSDFSPLNSIYVKQRRKNCCFSELVNSADFEFEMTSGRHFIRSGWRKIIIGLDPKSNKPIFLPPKELINRSTPFKQHFSESAQAYISHLVAISNRHFFSLFIFFVKFFLLISDDFCDCWKRDSGEDHVLWCLHGLICFLFFLGE